MRSSASVCLLLGTLLSLLALSQPAAADDVPSPAGVKAADTSKGKTYFIADNGDDRNPGTIERPFATLYKAHQVVGPGKLLFDLTWYDRGTKTLWFKAGPSRVGDPGSQLYVTSSSSGQFSVSGSYLRIHGLKIKYLFYFHQQDNPTEQEITNCEIKHGGGGICGGGTRCTYTSLFIDKIGGWLTWRNGGYDRAYLAHCFYFNGRHCLVSNCFFGRTTMGGPIQNYPYGFTDNVFDGNVLYNSSGGSIFMGTGNNVIKNNISLQKTYGLGPYIAMQGFTFAHNYSEAAFPFSFTCAEAKGEYRETFEKFTITDNVFNTTGGCVEYRGNIVDARPCNIDGNVYLGTPSWRVGLTQARPPVAKSQAHATYASYVAGLQACRTAAPGKRSRRPARRCPDSISPRSTPSSTPIRRWRLSCRRQGSM